MDEKLQQYVYQLAMDNGYKGSPQKLLANLPRYNNSFTSFYNSAFQVGLAKTPEEFASKLQIDMPEEFYAIDDISSVASGVTDKLNPNAVDNILETGEALKKKNSAFGIIIGRWCFGFANGETRFGIIIGRWCFGLTRIKD